MNYTDTTQTDWSEFEQQNIIECCPVTDASRTPGYVQVEYSGAALVSSHAELGGRSKSKLQAMFDKFLYQK